MSITLSLRLLPAGRFELEDVLTLSPRAFASASSQFAPLRALLNSLKNTHSFPLLGIRLFTTLSAPPALFPCLSSRPSRLVWLLRRFRSIPCTPSHRRDRLRVTRTRPSRLQSALRYPCARALSYTLTAQALKSRIERTEGCYSRGRGLASALTAARGLGVKGDLIRVVLAAVFSMTCVLSRLTTGSTSRRHRVALRCGPGVN